MQKQTGVKSFFSKHWPLLLGVGFIFGILVLNGTFDSPAVPQKVSVAKKVGEKPLIKEETVSEKKVLSVDKLYFAKHNTPDVFWLKGDEDSSEVRLLTLQWKDRIRTLMSKYKDISPLSQRIWKEFESFRVSMFFQGSSREFLVGKISDYPNYPNILEVCVVPQNEMNHPTLLSSTLYYRKEWGAVMVRAIDFSDEFYAAWMYHEMGHALRARVDKVNDRPRSDDWVWEEIEMHELESQILNEMSQGSFNKLQDRIIDRVESKGFTSAHAASVASKSMTQEDLDVFDRMFHLEGIGKKASSIALGQLMLSIRFRYIDLQSPVNERRNRKIQAYRRMVNGS